MLVDSILKDVNSLQTNRFGVVPIKAPVLLETDKMNTRKPNNSQDTLEEEKAEE